jgi:hypothetical protein
LCNAFRVKLKDYLTENAAKLRSSIFSWKDLSDIEFESMLSSICDCESKVGYSEELITCISMMTGFNIVVLDVAEGAESVDHVIYYSTDTLGMSFMSFAF